MADRHEAASSHASLRDARPRGTHAPARAGMQVAVRVLSAACLARSRRRAMHRRTDGDAIWASTRSTHKPHDGSKVLLTHLAVVYTV
eukprot:COSAG02_NODE_202_length_29305_cov_20.432377_18_plen_87_part_00